MYNDRITALPSQKNFEDFASKMWFSSADSRFAVLSLYISIENIMTDPILTMFIQKVIRTHDYMLSACCTEPFSFYVLLDLELVGQNQILSVIKRDLQDFYIYVHKVHPSQNFRLYGGICILSSYVPDINKAMAYALLAENKMKESNLSSEISVGFYRESLGNNQQENRILPLFENLMLNHHLVTYLQPKFKLDCSTPVGAEVLVRIMDVKGHLMKPDDFLPVLQKYHMTHQLDLMVIERILKLLYKWKQEGFTPLPVSINLAQGDFISEDFIQIFADIAAKYESIIHCLEFEIASDDFYSNIDYMESVIKELHQIGCRISLDSFGGDGLPLSALEISSVDMVKFHRNFLHIGMKNPKNLQIIKKMSEMFTECDIPVLCEGIENEMEENFIRQCNISYVQGFYYGRPVPWDIFQKKYMVPQSVTISS